MDRGSLSHIRLGVSALLVVLALLTALWRPTGAAPSVFRAQGALAAQSATLQTYSVAPQNIEPATAALQDSHVVAYDPGAVHPGQLFVFLEGFLAKASDTTLIVQQAAAEGFHAISLTYAKPAQIVPFCQSSPDDGCYEAARRAEIYGGSDGATFSVTPSDSIVNQLGKLLAYLAAQHPEQGWGAYIDESGAPLWSSIRLGGHSEGGTDAALIAQDHAVARLCVFESPLDLIGPPGGLRRLAPWIAAGGATPADRIYGFRHMHTSSPSWQGFEAAWGLFGLDAFGPSVDVDQSTPPYNGSHLLMTDAPPPVSDDTPNLVHRSVVEDRLTPKAATGEPLFAPVWQYACLS